MLIDLYRDKGHLSRKPFQITIKIDGNQSGRGDQLSRLELAGMAQALQRLSGEQREALLLVALESMSYEEASAILEIPIGVVMSRERVRLCGLRLVARRWGCRV